MSETKTTRLMSADDTPGAEQSVIAYWERNGVFDRSVEERPESNPFVFYEGPPTANGKPGVHHVLARLSKDLICRYKTMRGYRVVRKAGWDTHGLPVEIEVEAELGIENKDQIEEYGVAEFNAKCRESVFRYEKEWVDFTKRIGFWVDMQHPYITCENEYIESVWHILSEIWKKGLLYEGHKIVPYCPRCETSLSSHEVSQGYKDVSDPSVFVKFKRSGLDEHFLVWTTTPWTLISNAALAVGATYDYARVKNGNDTLVLAKELLGVLEGEYEILDSFKGAELVGSTYEPLFDFFAGEEGAFRVLDGDFVSLEDGTGIVHIAPAFGEDDYKLHTAEGVPLLQPVLPNGTFDESIAPWAGRFIKDADPDITRTLKSEGKLYKSGKVEHSYPFCWRCATPLVYYARKSWYIQTTKFKDQLIAANKKINWHPKEVGEYRFGNWLENNVDWSLSRERYWGTPLNIWVCSSCDHKDTIGSIDELMTRARNAPAKREDIDLHRPMMDEIELECPECKAVMRRVSEVIDVWFDSGSMPFAQYHYPWDESGMFKKQFPADYISEAIDQTRGWFYSMLAISVFLTGESSYKNCLCTELILDKDGVKMSKSRGNTFEPTDLLAKEGADALRWYLTTVSPLWVPTRFDRKGIQESALKLMGTLRNVYSFYAMYATVDGYVYEEDDRGEPGLLDRWILSRFHTTARRVTSHLDSYEVTRAARTVQTFVLDELSNWYVRRSRRRFWKGEMGPDKKAAYHTLYTVLDGVAKLLAPFTPFMSEEIHLALRGVSTGDESNESVHMELFPAADDEMIDAGLESQVEMAMTLSSLGRNVRNEAGIRVRQPLAELLVHSDSPALTAFMEREEVVASVLEELNVKSVRRVDSISEYASWKAKPNFAALGRRFGKQVPVVAKSIQALDTGVLSEFNRTGELNVAAADGTVSLTRDELTVSIEGKDGFGAGSDGVVTVMIGLEISDELRLEGLAREVVNRLQNLRKKAGLEVTDRIEVRYAESESTEKVFAVQGELIKNETLAVEAAPGGADWDHSVAFEIDGAPFQLWIRRAG
ncbi:MAG: isoleucine--tRNA ligase [Candidatus Latescibacterota bacterium]|jgi:isoleucyl-tRNA synthetase